MIATNTEIQILRGLARCRFLPGSFPKKFTRDVDIKNISPLQQWWIYKLGYMYRKQIGKDALTFICKNYIDANEKPCTRKESEKILKKAVRPFPNDEQKIIEWK